MDFDDFDDVLNQFDAADDSLEKKEQEQNENNIALNDELKDEETQQKGNSEFLNRRLSSQKLLVDDLRKKTKTLTDKLKQSQRNNRLLKDQIEQLQKVSDVQQDDVVNENITLKRKCDDWKAKYEEEKKENEQLKQELKQLQSENEQFKMKALDHNKWESWTSDSVYLYLMSIDDGLLQKYENAIKAFINESEVKGSDLPAFAMSDWADCGVNVFSDRKTVCDAIKLLKESVVAVIDEGNDDTQYV